MSAVFSDCENCEKVKTLEVLSEQGKLILFVYFILFYQRHRAFLKFQGIM